MANDTPVAEEKQEKPWHAMEPEEVLQQVNSSDKGLSEKEAQRRFEQEGPNSLEAKEGVSPWRILLRQVKSPLIYLLAGAAVVSLISGHTIDAGVIAGVVILNTILGFVQEWRAEGALAALREMAAPHARVYRNEQTKDIEASKVVPGDILILQTGDRVAADARLLESQALQADESALTGESEPAAKQVEPVDEETPVGDRHSMVWMSTNVTAGSGKAVVVASGMDSEMGQIAGQVHSTERQTTPLQKRMNRLGLILGVVGIILAGVVFGLGLLKGRGALEMALYAVAVAVSAIPEGLPAVITVTLALGVRRMAKRNAIIRRLPAVETLGSTTVICSDKTGTITRNQMTVRKIWADGRVYAVSGDGYEPEGEITREKGQAEGKEPDSEHLRRLLRIGALTNDSHLHREEKNWRIEGDPSEGALLVAARKGGLDPEELRAKVDRIDEIPFTSKRKYMATLHPKQEGESGRLVYVKGAPDRLLAASSHVIIDGERVELTKERRDEIARVNEDFASEALRVMAGAYCEVSGDKDHLAEEDVQEGLTLTGLWGMLDPPRDASIPAVEAARKAGIRPVMITGDYATTALAIAKQVGIADNGRVLSAGDVKDMDNPELANAALESGVFARVSPTQKIRILNALKEQGHVVAMTGDGVNDAPALKNADIGVAMGQAGTEVVKEAGDMILTDDNFATIVNAVEEGRVIFSNLRRVVFFLLTTNVGEVLTLSAALAFGLGLPLTAVMILWVNLVTDGVSDIPLGVEPKHRDVLEHPPRDPEEPIITKGVIGRIAILAPVIAVGTLGLYWYELQAGSHQHAQTIAFTTLAAFQWFHAFNARSRYESVFSIGLFSNKWLLAGVGTGIVLQVVVIQTSIGKWLFDTVPLNLVDWGLIVLVASSIFVVDEIMKRLGVYGKPGKKNGD